MSEDYPVGRLVFDRITMTLNPCKYSTDSRVSDLISNFHICWILSKLNGELDFYAI